MRWSPRIRVIFHIQLVRMGFDNCPELTVPPQGVATQEVQEMRRIHKAIGWAALFLVLCGSLWAQITTGTISGTVRPT